MFDSLITPLTTLTTEVGEVIMSFYKSDMDVKVKSDQTPLTVVDQTAHQLIVEGLEELTPGTPILSEESDEISFDERSTWSEYWLIDPLDGTRDFLEHTGEFCICVAYIKDNTPVFGMIYAPLDQIHYYTLDGQAFKRQNDVEVTLKTHAPSSPLQVVIGHHSFHNEQLTSHLSQQADYEISRLGSALKFCQIAQGRYDYYPRFGPCSEWDTAAGVCILQNAGGSVIDKNGEVLKYNTKDDLLSPVFFASGKP
ncbi:MAG TPA: 3'(2'),5'-bisphosphate nucleotidase [Gammaproteobacteria bacterium]|jgi:3'(2'), 5'-bisphosphate nucleotidase|nr:3'(2'),5'-bisphosphate nucleotidase [Gammaproteobacteria bacterium]HAP45274.1 3'(2'),5'-bisphosphate nucleotidase [Gammaproteobacteria bacterium]HAP92803.1 3'(2'),5'-bisphosphate nucleotidase [Gammaproteobacteria bacterium]HAU20630.1 3'(2'),5'-bisphosphate nucleotidase [Gammaproteobacteria bacterium]HBA28427.1 3'(2'),5'-bisphosphate nucleotidase [Gammaproteobacteria bacterium]